MFGNCLKLEFFFTLEEYFYLNYYLPILFFPLNSVRSNKRLRHVTWREEPKRIQRKTTYIHTVREKETLKFIKTKESRTQTREEHRHVIMVLLNIHARQDSHRDRQTHTSRRNFLSLVRVFFDREKGGKAKSKFVNFNYKILSFR